MLRNPSAALSRRAKRMRQDVEVFCVSFSGDVANGRGPARFDTASRPNTLLGEFAVAKKKAAKKVAKKAAKKVAKKKVAKKAAKKAAKK